MTPASRFKKRALTTALRRHFACQRIESSGLPFAVAFRAGQPIFVWVCRRRLPSPSVRVKLLFDTLGLTTAVCHITKPPPRKQRRRALPRMTIKELNRQI